MLSLGKRNFENIGNKSLTLSNSNHFISETLLKNINNFVKECQTEVPNWNYSPDTWRKPDASTKRVES